MKANQATSQSVYQGMHPGSRTSTCTLRRRPATSFLRCHRNNRWPAQASHTPRRGCCSRTYLGGSEIRLRICEGRVQERLGSPPPHRAARPRERGVASHLLAKVGPLPRFTKRWHIHDRACQRLYRWTSHCWSIKQIQGPESWENKRLKYWISRRQHHPLALQRYERKPLRRKHRRGCHLNQVRSAWPVWHQAQSSEARSWYFNSRNEKLST